ncbi:Mediator of RNA polymerase II transcription subunit 31 [Geodia barretti]|uniref:Mediator of RNA polymerase II transcription subunit 31 n=1 Tax=Geodia barretti TaxID=519541 RepID=A0AA35U0D5_GEOBA|nr:Mediator of RNA polymerase II transcription subunit 31 [Geodia barretti]
MAANAGSAAAGGEVKEDPERLRFQTELEFVQCLANPHYLNFLAQQGYLKEPEFINYLSYLQYWRQQEYAKFIKYPQCLHFLGLLQSEFFRRELAYAQCAKFIEEQQLQHWHLYNKKRSQFQQKILAKGKPVPVDK